MEVFNWKKKIRTDLVGEPNRTGGAQKKQRRLGNPLLMKEKGEGRITVGGGEGFYWTASHSKGHKNSMGKKSHKIERSEGGRKKGKERKNRLHL